GLSPRNPAYAGLARNAAYCVSPRLLQPARRPHLHALAVGLRRALGAPLSLLMALSRAHLVCRRAPRNRPAATPPRAPVSRPHEQPGGPTAPPRRSSRCRARNRRIPACGRPARPSVCNARRKQDPLGTPRTLDRSARGHRPFPCPLRARVLVPPWR